ncbi:MAG: T9SS type A sorting domain-containing protein [Bacteroidetes bacterium]|nr:T9SS type A sorting domain-containing protein [Bacteroidota bacterium]
MKKTLLTTISVFSFLTLLAQSPRVKTRLTLAPGTKPVPVRAQNGDPYQIPYINKSIVANQAQTKVQNRTQAITEDIIGKTTYDLQTNSAILNRLLKHSDGTISASWTIIPVGGASAARGTGYNYFDGSNWEPIPSARIQPTQRTGFANIVVTASGKEMDISHSSTLPGMLLTSRPAKGTGAWTENGPAFGQFADDTWAKAIAGGTNGESVHAIWQGSGVSATPHDGQDGPLYYSRSLDGGATWPILRSLIPAIDSTNNLGYGGDAYSIDSHGDTIAIVVGDLTTDLTLLKSVDNGTTWIPTVLQAFPIPFYNDVADSLPDFNGDGVSDDLETPSGDAHVMLDNNGMAHVFWSNVLIRDTSAADLLGFFQNALDYLLYWNEGFAPGRIDTVATREDLDWDGNIIIANGSQGGGSMGNYRGSVTQMPSSGIDIAGNIYLAYQSLCENCDTTAYGTSHKHVFVKASLDGGNNWTRAFDVDEDVDALNQECAFACMAKSVDNNIHLTYQRDGAPGHSLLATTPINLVQASWNTVESDIIYAKIPVITVGVKAAVQPASVGLSQNIPNPAKGITKINFSLSENGKVSFEVRNILGEVVYAENKGNQIAGSSSITLNTSEWSSGVYTYTLKVNDRKETKKLMVE